MIFSSAAADLAGVLGDGVGAELRAHAGELGLDDLVDLGLEDGGLAVDQDLDLGLFGLGGLGGLGGGGLGLGLGGGGGLVRERGRAEREEGGEGEGENAFHLVGFLFGGRFRLRCGAVSRQFRGLSPIFPRRSSGYLEFAARKRPMSALVEESCFSSEPDVSSGMIFLARTFPSCTPHWSNEKTSQSAPCVNTLCS